jgi:hypothetical protein
MEEHIKKFLKAVGVKSDVISQLSTGEFEEGVTVSDLAEGYTSEQMEVFKSKNGGYSEEELQEKIDEKVAIFKKTSYKKLSDKLGLGISGREMSEYVKDDNVLDIFKEKVDEKLEVLKDGTDEKLRKELETWKQNAHDAKENYDALQTKYENDINATKQEWEGKLRARDVDLLVRSKLSALDFADKENSEIYSEWIERKIRENYTINPDGTLLNKDGSGAAVNFSGNGKYQTIDEPIAALFEERGFGRKSSGGGGGGSGEPHIRTSGGTIITDNLSGKAKQMAEKIKQAQT